MNAMKLSLAIQTPDVPVQVPVTLLSGSLEEKLVKADQWGYDGVELITTDPASLDTAGLRLLLARCHLRVSAVASGGMAFAAKLTLLNADLSIARLARQRLDELIDLAGELNADVVTVGSFRGRAVGDLGSSLDRLAGILYQAGERARQAGVRIALEPLNRYEADLILTANQGLEFLCRIDHPAVGLLLDTYHVNIEESSWTTPFQEAMAAGRLYYVHLGDNNRQPPGCGLIDFPAILKALSDSGYSGWLSAELLRLPDGDLAGHMTSEAMRKWSGEL